MERCVVSKYTDVLEICTAFIIIVLMMEAVHQSASRLHDAVSQKAIMFSQSNFLYNKTQDSILVTQFIEESSI
jgi:hypothetical protein